MSPVVPKASTAIKSDEFAYGLPGSLPPVEEFDPFNFLDGADENKVKRFREAELAHGRVSMLAFIGFLVGEKVEVSVVEMETWG